MIFKYFKYKDKLVSEDGIVSKSALLNIFVF